MMKKKKERSMKGMKRFGIVSRIILGVFFIVPVLIAVLFSFVPNDLLLGGMPSIKEVVNNLTLENYSWIFENVEVFNYVKNSLMMCFIVIVTHAVFGSMGAYAFAFYDFKGKKLMFTLMTLAMTIPGEVCTVCNFLTVKNMGLLSTMVGLTITSWCSCHTVFMLRQSYLGLPKEIRESALIDGCGDIGYFIRFAIPLSMPTLAALSITSFIGIFNSYLWPLLIARDPSMYTINIGMSVLFTSETPLYGRYMAGAVTSMIIPILIFIIFQRQIVKGMTNGAVKG
ncbi:MAG: carbohydrate ABC transporter permease [Tyzzerella sp.]|nr:carbohydrate ABC transporter permease [Tyzzerella sp.]